MKERLPPLQGLYYFYIAAKLGSFKLAAKDLFVTAAAISQQIRQLEEFLGVELFLRQHRKVALTMEGKLLFDHTQKGFEHLYQGVRQINQDPNPNQLSISTLPSFAQHWLVPRIGRFRERYPSQELMIEPTSELVDFQSSSVDLCIRYGRGEYPNLESRLMMEELLYPVCHPIYQQQHGIYELNDLTGADLIEDDWPDMSWGNWLQNVGYKRHKPTLIFSGSHFVLEGALSVQGVALAKHSLVHRYIEEGKLVRIGRLAQRTDFKYFLCAPSAYFKREKIRHFCDWIFNQVEEAEAFCHLDCEIIDTRSPS
ncbi:LysR substrate-binding domain-containing protein [Vibrio japonicus]|uniref:LysR substrate-binding domain-containing protein n=1 Tax=Vibrio japonicus TaxID=1824638 RepID=A0ABY5LDH9_9VIBR|nr:LysR substrate-binding domain-containing protein [Vibrio japonicus]UUM30088.1 LysR substrate-binding domain-containing protein [Vibrio japonicus]